MYYYYKYGKEVFDLNLSGNKQVFLLLIIVVVAFTVPQEKTQDIAVPIFSEANRDQPCCRINLALDSDLGVDRIKPDSG
jgi:hypothetical protein